MLKNEQLRLLKGLLNHLDAKTNVDAGGIMQTPSDTYTSKERFDLEWQSFFQNYPQHHYQIRFLILELNHYHLLGC